MSPSSTDLTGDLVVLIDRRSLAEQMPWIVTAVLGTTVATVWFFVAGIGSSEWPGGSSLPGFTFGVLGGLIILFELLLWWRKKVRAWRIGRAKIWMRAHIWLGLLCLPLLVYHSGFRLGGLLSSVVMVLLWLVIASGIVGLIFQQVIPQRLLNEVPAETIYSQIDHVISQLAKEAERLMLIAPLGSSNCTRRGVTRLDRQSRERGKGDSEQ